MILVIYILLILLKNFTILYTMSYHAEFLQ